MCLFQICISHFLLCSPLKCFWTALNFVTHIYVSSPALYIRGRGTLERPSSHQSPLEEILAPIFTPQTEDTERHFEGEGFVATAAAAKSLQSCPTLFDPIDSSPLGSSVPGILQARTLEWVVISVSNAWKWKVKVKSLSRARLLATPWTGAYQAPLSMGFSRQEYWSGVPCSRLMAGKEPLLWGITGVIGLKLERRQMGKAKMMVPKIPTS